MSHIDAAPRGIEEISHGWLGLRDEASRGGLLVWRVRVWLVALAVGLIAANAHDDGVKLARREAARQAECSAPATGPVRQRAGSAPPAQAFARCLDLDGSFGPGDL